MFLVEKGNFIALSDLSSLSCFFIHPVDMVKDLIKLLPDIPNHLLHGLFSFLLEVLPHVHTSNRGGEGTSCSTWIQYNLYIYFACLSVCLFVCPFVKTAKPIGPKFCVEPHITPNSKKNPPKFENDLQYNTI